MTVTPNSPEHPGSAPAAVAPVPREYERSLSGGVGIRIKLIVAVGAVAAGILLFILIAVGRHYATIERSAVLEATRVAQGVADVAGEMGMVHGDALQAYVEQLAQRARRDVVIVDLKRRGLADTDVQERGEIFANPGGEVEMTLADGRPRDFIEPPHDGHPEGVRQVAVPVRQSVQAGAPIVGAVILEYSPLRDELLAGARGDLTMMIAAGLTLVVFICGVGAGVLRQVIDPLRDLQEGVRQINGHDYGARVRVAREDELGMLARSFNEMARTLTEKEVALQLHQTLLEQRITDRTAALNIANETLRAEIDERRLVAARNEYLANYDSLTALPNRARFAQLLCAATAAARQAGGELGLLFIDLDRFKNINDTLGHAAGDEFLREISRRLGACVRSGDTVARLGGDEFVVLLPAPCKAFTLEAMARKILLAAGQPFLMAGQELHVSASIGAALFTRDGADDGTLMKNAAVAMYRAKEQGKNRCCFYSADFDARAQERVALEGALRRALERGEMEVHYQPKVEAGGGAVGGMEALLRWRHPDLGLVPPGKFIPIAEETGLILEIGKWVLRRACADNARWCREYGRRLSVAVNLSARQFIDGALAADVRAALRDSGMDPALLELEITESMLMADIAQAVGVLGAVKALGVRVAIDDFGTGYSSLSNLKNFPLDTIKIDRAFVCDLPGDASDRGITEAIIAMGRAMELKVVAEGVETREQADFLRERFCDQFQGWFYGPAVPAAEFERLWVMPAPEPRLRVVA